MEFFKSFLATFIPLMVALDAPGTLALYVGMTEGVMKQERKKIVRQSIITAFLVTLGFILVGQAIFNALGILVEDFMIAGGVVLLIIAIADVVRAGERKMERSAEFGVVPLGTPIIAGPGTLTAALVLVGTNGYVPVILSLVVNLLFAWVIFAQSERIIRIIGISGSRAFAKVVSLILAAFAVKMIRSGIFRVSRRSLMKKENGIMRELREDHESMCGPNRRVHMANERTFLAWVRTSIAIMAFGFVVEKFSLFVKQMGYLPGEGGHSAAAGLFCDNRDRACRPRRCDGRAFVHTL